MPGFVWQRLFIYTSSVQLTPVESSQMEVSYGFMRLPKMNEKALNILKHPKTNKTIGLSIENHHESPISRMKKTGESPGGLPVSPPLGPLAAWSHGRSWQLRQQNRTSRPGRRSPWYRLTSKISKSLTQTTAKTTAKATAKTTVAGGPSYSARFSQSSVSLNEFDA